MAIKVKANGAYVDALAIYVKKNGVYQAVAGAYAKINGAYQSILPPTLFRFGSTNNRNAQNDAGVVAGVNGMGVDTRKQATLVGGDANSVVFKMDNRYAVLNSSVVANGPASTINGWYVTLNGANPKRVTFLGANTRAVAAGELDILCDPILPSLFSLATFPVGSVFELRSTELVPSGGVVALTTNQASALSKTYDPTATTLTNLNGTGSFTYTGAAPASVNERSIMMLANYVTEPIVIMGCGDSFFQNGPSYIQSLLSGDGANLIPGCNISRAAGTSQIVVDYPDYFQSFTKYANRVVDEWGRNYTSPSTLAKTQANALVCWATYRAGATTNPNATRPFKIIRAKLAPNTTGTFATTAGQTIVSGANAGELDETFGDWMDTVVGTPTGPDIVVDINVGTGGALRASPAGKGTTGSDYYKWGLTSGSAVLTADGKHPNQAASDMIGNNIRAACIA